MLIWFVTPTTKTSVKFLSRIAAGNVPDLFTFDCPSVMTIAMFRKRNRSPLARLNTCSRRVLFNTIQQTKPYPEVNSCKVWPYQKIVYRLFVYWLLIYDDHNYWLCKHSVPKSCATQRCLSPILRQFGLDKPGYIYDFHHLLDTDQACRTNN